MITVETIESLQSRKTSTPPLAALFGIVGDVTETPDNGKTRFGLEILYCNTETTEREIKTVYFDGRPACLVPGKQVAVFGSYVNGDRKGKEFNAQKVNYLHPEGDI